MKRLKITVSGIVQGVGFRYFCLKIANELKVYGYAKNLYNGDVVLEIEGGEFLLKEYVKELKIGPAHADVKTVNVEEKEYTGEFKSFRIY